MPLFVLGSEKIVVSVSVEYAGGAALVGCSALCVVSVDWASIFCAVSVGMFPLLVRVNLARRLVCVLCLSSLLSEFCVLFVSCDFPPFPP